MRVHPSHAFEATAALLTACLFFSLSETAGRKSALSVAPPGSATAAPLMQIQADSLTDSDQPRTDFLHTLQPVEPIVIEHGPRMRKVIALTFDACSTQDPGSFDERASEILIQTQTPATLFLGGKWMLEEAEQTKRLAANPLFELGNHAYLHPHLRDASDERIRYEIQSTQDVMDSLTGRRASLFRPPYGEYDDRVVRIAASLGLKTVQFDLASGDPDPEISKERLIRYVSSMARGGSIIVMHINRRGWHTAEALPEIISRLRQQGFVFRTVSAMLRPQEKADGEKTNEHQ